MRLTRFAPFVLSLAVICLAACSSKQGDVTTPGASGAATASGDAPVDNPQGVPYPTTSLGTSPRGLVNGAPAKTRGDVIRNYTFRGYPTGDKSKGMQTISLADYFDPSAKVKVLHILAVDVWCSYCNDETDALVKAMGTPADAKDVDFSDVVFLEAVAEGPTANVAATQTDLDLWIYVHHPAFAQVLDPEAQNLGVFFDVSSVPWNANVDARSMEILSTAGYDDLTKPEELQVWIDWEKKNAPAY